MHFFLDTSISLLPLQVCLLECEGHVSSSLTWEVCRRAVSRHPTLSEGAALFKRTGEELQLTSLDLDSDGEPAADEAPFEQRGVRYDSSPMESEEDGEGPRGPVLSLLADGEREVRNVGSDGQQEGLSEDEGSEAVVLSKRFGGFQRGRHGYRKLIGSPMRALQKRYGGFIGVRKSARKWNSQKRMNQLLRQYLGMRSSRSGRFNSAPVTRVWRQNQL